MKYQRRTFLRFACYATGALMLGSCSKKMTDALRNVDYYTCAMHPSVHLPDPGQCPICSMELIPVMKNGVKQNMGETAATSEFTVPEERQQQIGVTFATVARKPLRHTVRAVGMVQPDKTKHWEFVARTDGYVKTLYVTSPGEIVERDQPLMSIYSPDLLTAQREFADLLAMRDKAAASHSQPAVESADRLMESARRRLKQWNVTDEQIAGLEKTRKPSDTLTLLSPFRGIVEAVPVDQGRSVKMGDHLVDVLDISTVWVIAEFYENEIPMLQRGQKITVTSGSLPSEKFEGEIRSIDPFVDEMKRTAKVRIDIANPDFKLQPSMFVNVELAMDMGEALTIPVSAVMPTGAHEVVFVDKGKGRLEPRYVELGAKYGDLYELKSGLQEGERVVASANFLIDAEAKVSGALKAFQETEMKGKQ